MRHRPGAHAREARAVVSALLHDETPRVGDGAFDLPQHHRSPSRPSLGGEQPDPDRAQSGPDRRHFFFYAADRRERSRSIEERDVMNLKRSSTVFIVDDNPSVRKALTRLVRSAGYEVKAFASAKEFLSDTHDDGVACVVLDIRMPGLSGIDLQHELNYAKKI